MTTSQDYSVIAQTTRAEIMQFRTMILKSEGNSVDTRRGRESRNMEREIKNKFGQPNQNPESNHLSSSESQKITISQSSTQINKVDNLE